jgi:hypothetical protein
LAAKGNTPTKPTACYPVSVGHLSRCIVPSYRRWCPHAVALLHRLRLRGCLLAGAQGVAHHRLDVRWRVCVWCTAYWCGEAGIRFVSDEAMRRLADPAAASAFVLCTQYAGVWTVAGMWPATCTSTKCAAARWCRYPYIWCATHGHGVDGLTVWLMYSRTGRDVDACRARWCLLLACTCGRPPWRQLGK